jgi:hypothetical protein
VGNPEKIRILFLIFLYLPVFCGYGSLLLAGWIHPIWMTLGGVSLVVGILLDMRGEYPISHKYDRPLLVLGLILALIDWRFISRNWLLTVMMLLMYVVSLRALSPKANRDLLQMIAIALFELLGSAILTTDLAYGIFLFLFLCIVPFTLLLVAVKAELEGETNLLKGKTLEGPLLLPPSLSRFFHRHIALLMGITIFTTLIVTFLFFTFFPRFTIGQFSARLLKDQPISGFSPEIRLGEMGAILSNSTPVARVRFWEPPPPSILNEFYLRGFPLKEFDGENWKRGEKQRFQTLYSSTQTFLLGSTLRNPSGVTIYLEDIGVPYLLFLPLQTLSLKLPTTTLFLYEDGSVALPFARYPLKYEAFFLPSPLPDLPWEKIPSFPLLPPHLIPYTELPSGISIPPEIEKRIQGKELGWVPQVLKEFRSYTYTLELPGPNPLATFFSKKKGHCELFATAFIILLRKQGIPARIVNGFRGGEWIEEGGYLLVRERNAHSWVEAWIPSYGWIPLDPTPPSEPPKAFFSLVVEQYQRMVERLKFLWITYIVDYNWEMQKEGWEKARQKTRFLFAPQKFSEPLRIKISTLFFPLLVFLIVLFLLTLAPFLRKKGSLKTPLTPLLKILYKHYPRPPHLPFLLYVKTIPLPETTKKEIENLYLSYTLFRYRKAGNEREIEKAVKEVTIQIRESLKKQGDSSRGKSLYNREG